MLVLSFNIWKVLFKRFWSFTWSCTLLRNFWPRPATCHRNPTTCLNALQLNQLGLVHFIQLGNQHHKVPFGLNPCWGLFFLLWCRPAANFSLLNQWSLNNLMRFVENQRVFLLSINPAKCGKFFGGYLRKNIQPITLLSLSKVPIASRIFLILGIFFPHRIYCFHCFFVS